MTRLAKGIYHTHPIAFLQFRDQKKTLSPPESLPLHQGSSSHELPIDGGYSIDTPTIATPTSNSLQASNIVNLPQNMESLVSPHFCSQDPTEKESSRNLWSAPEDVSNDCVTMGVASGSGQEVGVACGKGGGVGVASSDVCADVTNDSTAYSETELASNIQLNSSPLPLPTPTMYLDVF